MPIDLLTQVARRGMRTQSQASGCGVGVALFVERVQPTAQSVKISHGVIGQAEALGRLCEILGARPVTPVSRWTEASPDFIGARTA